ncbi:MAG: hypothetical protein EBS32_12680, partial [Actinobacteria bacterium]|nr:hypothetical protein [Actinomycetota bacterium]
VDADVCRAVRVGGVEQRCHDAARVAGSGAPGPHVTAAVAAVEKLGATVEFGPFGTTLRATAGDAGRVVAALLDAAYANGATHVSIHVGPEDE